jgi:hypothetical protein
MSIGDVTKLGGVVDIMSHQLLIKLLTIDDKMVRLWLDIYRDEKE